MTDSIKLVAVGDISFGDFPFCPGMGVRSRLIEDKSPFNEVSKILSTGDIVFGNLETCLSDIGLDSKKLTAFEMRGKPESAAFLRAAGFNVLNMANNHTMQHGMVAFDETVQGLRKEKINVIGLRNESLHPLIMRCKGRSVGFLGFAFEQDNYGNKSLGYSYGPSCSLKKDIESIKRKVDILIISCHWGVEFMNKPSPYTVSLGRKMIDWGADIILGHHSHVVQGIEQYKKGLIIYSLGNFLFDMLWDIKLKNSYIFTINLGDTLSYELIPVVIADDYNIHVKSDPQEALHYFNQLCRVVHSYGTAWDWERMALSYYGEYFALFRRNRFKTYLYFVRNFYKIDPNLFFQVIKRSTSRWSTRLGLNFFKAR